MSWLNTDNSDKYYQVAWWNHFDKQFICNIPVNLLWWDTMEETAPSHLGKLCQIEKAALFQCSTRSYYWLEHRKVSFLYTNWEMQLFVSINSYSMSVLIGKVWTLVIAINMLFMKEVVRRHREPAGYGNMDPLICCCHWTGWRVKSGNLSG